MNAARELLKAAATRPEGLESFLETHELTPQLAAEVRELFVAYANAGRLETAELAANVVALLWLRLDNSHEMFHNTIDYLQVRFQRAQDATSYAAVRTETLDMLSRLLGVREDEFVFRAAVLAADACYYGHRAGGERLGLRVPLMLADVVAAANYAQRASPSTWFPRFIELTAAVVWTAMSEHVSEDDRGQADRSLRILAGDVGSLLPTSRYFPEDPKKASRVDALLTALVNQYRQ
jgi:hypothetical protein